MVTEAQYATVVQHFLEELSNVLAARADHLARHAEVRQRAAELRAEWQEAWQEAAPSDGELLRAAAALTRLGIDGHWPALVREAHADFVHSASPAPVGPPSGAGSQRAAMTAAVAQLWAEHQAEPFPAAVYGVEVDGYDVALLDADIAGCVEAFLAAGGRLALGRTAALGLLLRHAALAARALPAAARPRYVRLERLGQLVLQAVRDSTPAT
jgi:hypothetical protein